MTKHTRGLHREAEQAKARDMAEVAYAAGWEAAQKGEVRNFDRAIGYVQAIADLAKTEGASALARDLYGLRDDLLGVEPK
jgi:hypothetical protein